MRAQYFQLLLCLRIFLASGINEGLADGISGLGGHRLNEAYGQRRATETVDTRATTEAAQKDAHHQDDELQEQASGFVDTPDNCDHPTPKTHGITYIGENIAGAVVHPVESDSVYASNSGHRGQYQVDGARRIHQTGHIPIRSTDPASVGRSGGQDNANNLHHPSRNVDASTRIQQRYSRPDGYALSDRQIVRSHYLSQQEPTTNTHRRGSGASDVQNQGHEARSMTIQDNTNYDTNGLIPEQHVHSPPSFPDADAGTHVQSNYPTIIQLEEFVRPLTTEACQAQINFTGWAEESEGAGEAPTSSSGGSRRKKRRSDDIDDDNGIGSSLTSASAEREAKRPRRNGKKGLEPSASSSRTGTTAGASDLQTHK